MERPTRLEIIRDLLDRLNEALIDHNKRTSDDYNLEMDDVAISLRHDIENAARALQEAIDDAR